MRISKYFILIVAAIAVAVVGLGAFVFSRPKAVPCCIQSMRPYPPEVYEQWHREEARVLAVLPKCSTFSNAVAILGSDYTTVSNDDTLFWVDFNCVLPGMTNKSDIIFLVENGIVEWRPMEPLSMKFPPYQHHASDH